LFTVNHFFSSAYSPNQPNWHQIGKHEYKINFEQVRCANGSGTGWLQSTIHHRIRICDPPATVVNTVCWSTNIDTWCSQLAFWCMQYMLHMQLCISWKY